MNHIEGGIDDSQVKREEEHDRLPEEQDPWPTQSSRDQSLDIHLPGLLVLAPVDLPSGRAERLGSRTEEDRRVGFRDDEETEDCESGCEHRDESCYPSPAACLA